MRNRIADELNNAPGQQCAIAAMDVIDRLQSHWENPGVIVIGACAVFQMICDHYGVTPQDAFQVTQNCMNDTNGRYVPEFRAVKDYVENEL